LDFNLFLFFLFFWFGISIINQKTKKLDCATVGALEKKDHSLSFGRGGRGSPIPFRRRRLASLVYERRNRLHKRRDTNGLRAYMYIHAYTYTPLSHIIKCVGWRHTFTLLRLLCMYVCMYVCVIKTKKIHQERLFSLKAAAFPSWKGMCDPVPQ